MNIKDINNIYCITLYTNKDRLNNSQKIKKMFNNDKFEFKYATPHIWYNNIYQMLKFDFPGQLGVAISHYEVVNFSYYSNFDYVLICEDDITFNVNEITHFINNAPNDFDILQCYALDIQLPNNITVDKNDLLNEYNNNILWHKVNNNCTRFGTVFYILNKKGMKYYLDRQNENFRIADYPFLISYNYNINHYIPTKTIIKEIGLKSTASDYKQ